MDFFKKLRKSVTKNRRKGFEQLRDTQDYVTSGRGFITRCECAGTPTVVKRSSLKMRRESSFRRINSRSRLVETSTNRDSRIEPYAGRYELPACRTRRNAVCELDIDERCGLNIILQSFVQEKRMQDIGMI